MKLHSLFLLVASLFAVAGCTSIPTTVDTGVVRAGTFNFISGRAKAELTYADNRAEVHAMIQAAISQELGTKGVHRVASGGDVTVAYLLIVGNNATTRSINEYYGYSEDVVALHDKAHEAYTGNKNPNHFEAGTLVIDIVDGKTFKLLKRGYASRSVLRDLPANQRAARIQEVVNQILRDVRFAQ